MKKYLIGLFVLLFVTTSATPPLKRSAIKMIPQQIQRKELPTLMITEAEKHIEGTAFSNVPNRQKASNQKPFYKRPAGAFYVNYISVGGSYGYAYSSPFLYVKPFAEYTYRGAVTGADENTHVAWDIFKYDGGDNYFQINDEIDASVAYGFEISKTPMFYAVDGELDDPNAAWYTYQIVNHSMGGSDDAPVIMSENPVQVFSVPSDVMISGDTNVDYWCSSKTMVGGGRNGDLYHPMTAHSGADPYPGNEYGWYFGKNGEHIDGIGQAFEKPSKPYLLKKVGLYVASSHTVLTEDNVKLKCYVYKLDQIPAYNDTASVVLPLVPGELIASGEGNINQAVLNENYGFIEFTLFDEEGDIPDLTHGYTPTIDCPILVTIEGYNDIEGLQEFTAFISADDHVDEGYGELAYLKCPIYTKDIDGNGSKVDIFTGEYKWTGLNNYFKFGKMMTGFSIYISTENPFITFMYSVENGEHTFPNEGGELIKDIEIEGETYQIEGIDFYSWIGSEGGDWLLTWNGSDNLPEWLDIELEDVEGSVEDGREVYVSVTAQPLPEDVPYREAVIRFNIPGDYIDYKFMQGDYPGDTTLYDFKINGIYYKKAQDNEAIVTYHNSRFNTYNGDIVIPEVVEYQGKIFSVTGIGENAFKNCINLSSVAIPVSIKTIASNAFDGSNPKSISITNHGEWQAGALPSNINTLYVGSGVTSVKGMKVNPTTIYSYSKTPSICDENSFTDYIGSLHVPSSAIATYFSAPFWCNFADIEGGAVEPISLTLNQDTVFMNIGERYNLTATLLPNNATPKSISWHSTNEKVATVNNGEIESIKKGECDIIATCVDKQYVCHILVEVVLPTSVCLNVNDTTVIEGSQFPLTAIVLPENTSNPTVSWESSNPLVATVKDGNVSTITAGDCYIIAKCGNKQDSCHVSVTKQLIFISLDKHEASLLPNHIITLTPSVSSGTESFIVSSSDPSIAMARIINNKVQVVGVAPGYATITVNSTSGIAIPDSCLITVYTEDGDINNDGFIDINDATLLIDFLLGNNMDYFNVDNADINNDGFINIKDVTELIDNLLSYENSKSNFFNQRRKNSPKSHQIYKVRQDSLFIPL